jgi:hypothetical protein
MPLRRGRQSAPPLGEGREQHFGVAVRPEGAPAARQHLAQLAEVVDLAVEGQREAAVVGEHRFVPGRARVDDRQAPVPQTRAAGVALGRRRRPHALVVAPAMPDCLEHRAHAPHGLSPDDSGDSTHV